MRMQPSQGDDQNKEDKEGGGNPGSLPSRWELERKSAKPERRSLQEDLAHKRQLNEEQAGNIADPNVDKAGNQKGA